MSRPNDRHLKLFCASPGLGWDYWRFVVYYPDFEWIDAPFAVADVSEPLGECLTPPVLPNPCYWDGPPSSPPV